MGKGKEYNKYNDELIFNREYLNEQKSSKGKKYIYDDYREFGEE